MAIRYFGKYTVRTQYTHSAIGRFLEKIMINPDKVFEGTPCWEWQGAMNHLGYGRFRSPNETYAHRFAHRYFIGEIPDGFEIDHRCRNRGCQSPFHIQTVTHAANQVLRTDVKTHCINGHPCDGQNTHVNYRGERVCKKCRYLAVKRWRENHPEEAKEIGRESKASWRDKQRDAGRTGRY